MSADRVFDEVDEQLAVTDKRLLEGPTIETYHWSIRGSTLNRGRNADRIHEQHDEIISKLRVAHENRLQSEKANSDEQLQGLKDLHQGTLDGYVERLRETEGMLKGSEQTLNEAQHLLDSTRERCIKAESDLQTIKAREQAVDLVAARRAKEQQAAAASRHQAELAEAIDPQERLDDLARSDAADEEVVTSVAVHLKNGEDVKVRSTFAVPPTEKFFLVYGLVWHGKV